jgi:hypothetical protein
MRIAHLVKDPQNLGMKPQIIIGMRQLRMQQPQPLHRVHRIPGPLKRQVYIELVQHHHRLLADGFFLRPRQPRIPRHCQKLRQPAYTNRQPLHRRHSERPSVFNAHMSLV